MSSRGYGRRDSFRHRSLEKFHQDTGRGDWLLPEAGIHAFHSYGPRYANLAQDKASELSQFRMESLFKCWQSLGPVLGPDAAKDVLIISELGEPAAARRLCHRQRCRLGDWGNRAPHGSVERHPGQRRLAHSRRGPLRCPDSGRARGAVNPGFPCAAEAGPYHAGCTESAPAGLSRQAILFPRAKLAMKHARRRPSAGGRHARD